MTASEVLFLILGLLVGYILKDFFPSFFKEKGKNLATKQDIKEITSLQEEVKTSFLSNLEQQKAELNRISKEFELYVVKKHEYYPQLNKFLVECVSKVTSLRGHRDGIDLKMYEIEEITGYMEENSFIEADKKYVLSNWNDHQKHVAIHHIEKLLIKKEYIEAKESYRIAHNFYTLHLLYFSDEVSTIVPFLLSDIRALLNKYNPDLMMLDANLIPEDIFVQNEEAEDKVDQRLNELFAQMQKELKTQKE